MSNTHSHLRLRYYPVLASLQLRNITVRFFVCLYMIGDMIYAIVREGSCMGFLPLSRYYSALEEATLRMVGHRLFQRDFHRRFS